VSKTGLDQHEGLHNVVKSFKKLKVKNVECKTNTKSFCFCLKLEKIVLLATELDMGVGVRVD
jgi:hypothetical protein